MGAFDFAMGRLSSLSSAFSLPKGSGKNPVKVNNLSIALSDNALRAFTEFTIGMRMLHKHSIHHGFSVANITRQNLKLLHTNLNATPAYRETIAKIRSRAVTSNHWAWLPLLANKEINAGLLYLPAGHSVTPFTAGANVTLYQKGLHTPFPAAGSGSAGSQLYLGLTGETYIECVPPATALAPSGLAFSAFNKKIEATSCIKRGDTFVEDPALHKVHRLISTHEPCLLLNVHMLQLA
ncbi:MAG TPA: hypothetical protein VIM41_08980 [Gammaproteobacteria bacterium]